MELWSLAKALDMVEFAKMRYNLLGNAGHWFPGRKAGQADAVDIRRALRGHPLAERIAEVLQEAHAMLEDGERQRMSQDD